jgi:hypothetical protein
MSWYTNNLLTAAQVKRGVDFDVAMLLEPGAIRLEKTLIGS